MKKAIYYFISGTLLVIFGLMVIICPSAMVNVAATLFSAVLLVRGMRTLINTLRFDKVAEKVIVNGVEINLDSRRKVRTTMLINALLSAVLGLVAFIASLVDALLPVDQLEWLSRPRAFCMGEAFDKADSVVSGSFVVMGILRHELRRCIIFQLSQVPHLHEKGGCPPVAAFVFLVVFVHQDRQRHFRCLVLRRNIQPPVVVVNNLAADLQRCLADPASVDPVLAACVVGFHPVMNDRVLAVALRNSNRTFVPHIRFLRFS